jgi:hypothetical protein
MFRRSPETKEITSAHREELIERLLDSPLAKEMQREISEGATAIRARAEKELPPFVARNRERIAALQAAADVLIEKRDSAKDEAERLAREADRACDLLRSTKERFRLEEIRLRELCTAGAERLRELRCLKADDVPRAVREA